MAEDNNKVNSPAEEETSQGMEDLLTQDEEETKKPAPDSEDTETEPEGEDEESGEEEVNAYQERINEKEAENLFLRGEIAKLTRAREAGASAQVTPKTEEDDFDYEEIARKLVDKDPKVAAKTIAEMATKIAAKTLEKGQVKTQELVRESDAERTAKERDRDQTYADFAPELDNPEFEKLLTQLYRNNVRAAGRYVPDILYQSAATAKVILDKQRERKNGTKNGVTELRARRESPETIVADTHDYSKVVTIEGIPGSMLTPNEKRAARSAARTMGVSEKAWVKNFFAAKDEDANFGR